MASAETDIDNMDTRPVNDHEIRLRIRAWTTGASMAQLYDETKVFQRRIFIEFSRPMLTQE